MAEIFLNRTKPKFVFFTNYKVMFSSLYFALPKYFPDLERNPDFSQEKLDDYLKFAIVRNPYSRFESLYLDKCIQDPQIKLNFTQGVFLQPCQAQVLEARNKIKNINEQIAVSWVDITNNQVELEKCQANFKSLQKISFAEFIEIVIYILSLPNPDPHFQQQYLHLYRDAKLLPDFIYKLEKIDTVWPEVCSMLEVDIKLPQENKTSNKNYQKYSLDRNLRKKVYALYSEDFERFVY